MRAAPATDTPVAEALGRPVVLVTDGAGVRAAAADCARFPVVGIDTETTGLDPHLSRLRLVQVATPERVWVIDVFRAGTLEPLAPLLADPGVEKALHNAKFDLKFLRAAGLRDVAGVFDTMLASQVLACGHAAGESHSLRALAGRWLGLLLSKEEQISDWSGGLSPSQIEYAARDSAVLLPLREKLLDALRSQGLELCARLEFAAVSALADIEYNGFPLDLGMWEELGARIRAEGDAAADALRRLLPPRRSVSQGSFFGWEEEGWNPDAPHQMREALARAGVEVPDTRDETLRPLAALHPAVAALLEYRRASKALSAFVDAYPQFVHQATGRIHAEFWQCKSASGRILCEKPNLQQCPRDPAFRACFRVPEGRAMVIADFSQIELRIMAALSKDARMLDAYSRGEDLHRLTAALVTGRGLDEVTKEDRQIAKSCNFGLIYSMTPAGLAKYARVSYGVEMPLEDAERFHRAFFSAYRGVAEWHRKVRAFAERHRHVRTRSGRVRRWLSGEEMRVGEIYNTPDQGTGADIIKRAMARVRPRLLRLGAELIHCVHDELVAECPEEVSEEVMEALCEEMRAAGEEFIPEVPVEVGAAVGRSWADKL